MPYSMVFHFLIGVIGLSGKSEWLAGPVEVLLPQVLSSHHNSDEFVVVLDPPRNGVRKEVIHALRNNPLIWKIIYISCKADLAMGNFEEQVEIR